MNDGIEPPQKAKPARRHYPFPDWRGWERAHHRAILLVLEGLGTLAAGSLILLLLLAIRLASSPLEIDFLTPQLVAWIGIEFQPLTARIDGTSLYWAGRSTVALNARHLRLIGSDGREILSVPEISGVVTLRDLLRGRLALQRLSIIDPSIRLVPTPNGGIGISGASPGWSGGGPLTVAAIRDGLDKFSLARAGNHGKHLSLLSLNNAQFVIMDAAGAVDWQVDNVDLNIHRGAGNIVAAGTVLLVKGGHQTRGQVDLTYASASRAVGFRLVFDPIKPADWRNAVGAESLHLDRLALPIRGSVGGQLTLDDALRLDRVAVDLTAGRGVIFDPFFVDGAASITAASLEAHYDASTSRFFLDHGYVDIGGPTASLEGEVSGLPPLPGGLADLAHWGPMPVRFELTARSIPLDHVPMIWPSQFHPRTYDWVVHHLISGTLKNVVWHGGFAWEPGFDPVLVRRRSNGTMQFSDATLSYLPDMPAVTNIDADTRFGTGDFIFTVLRGRSNGLSIDGGVVQIDRLDHPELASNLTVDLKARGPAKGVAQILAVKRLAHLLPRPVDPANTDGTVAGTLHLHLPMIKDIPPDGIKFATAAHLSDFTLLHTVPSFDVTRGDLTLTADNDSVATAGTALLNGAPGRFDLNQTGHLAMKHLVLSLRTLVSQEVRQQLGLDPLPDDLSGPVGVNVRYESLGPHRATARVALDLKPAAVTIDVADWNKDAGIPGQAQFTATMTDGKATRLSDIELVGPGLDAGGELSLVPGSAILDFAARRLILGKSDVVGDFRHDPAGWHISVSGPSVDLAPFIARLDQNISPETRAAAPPLFVDVATDHLLFGTGRETETTRLSMRFQHLRMVAAHLDGQAGTAPARFDLIPPDQGGRIEIEAGDFGGLCHAVGISDHLLGGTLKVAGQVARNGEKLRYWGTMDAADYRVVRAPMMTKLLSMVSFSSILSQLRGTGIPFTAAHTDFVLDDGMLTITDGHSYGGALGLNADGWFNLDTKTMSVEGTIIPAYMFNSALEHIPMIGHLISGGKNEGLFAANFTMGGLIDNPDVRANPLSILAPGVLRDLFVFRAPKAGSATPPAH